MGFADKLKDFGDKAKLAAAEHKDQISQAVESAGAVADQRTGGKYRDKISKATQKADGALEKFAADGEPMAQGEHPAPNAPARPGEPPAPIPVEPGERPAPSPPTLT
jgi:hypothetical protein